MMANERLSFEHRPNGKLVFYSTRRSLDRAVEQMRLQARLGCSQQVLSADDCLALEPALRSVAHRLAGAIFTPSDEAGDCRKLCEELYRVLRERRYKVRFKLSCTAESLLRDGSRIVGVRTSAGIVDADHYVLCNGLGSRALVHTAGRTLALYPITGYSISPSIVDQSCAPRHSITDYERKIVYAPLGSVLRVAGFADISRHRRAEGERLAALARELEQTFPGVCAAERMRPWVGSRPATPDGMPIVGRVGCSNLLLNVGHGALGFTLAAGSARLIADALDEKRKAVPYEFWPYQTRLGGSAG
jgi:D-amino-acid dehydrogenase